MSCQILKKAQRECGKTMGAIPAHIRDKIENDLATAAKRFLATLVHKEPGVCVVRQQCLEMAAPQLFVHVIMKFTVMIEFVGRLQAMHPSAALKKVVRICQNIHQLLNALSRDELMMRLFQFVVCCSNEAMHAQLQEILALEYERLTPSQPTDETNTKELPSLGRFLPTLLFGFIKVVCNHRLIFIKIYECVTVSISCNWLAINGISL